MRALPLRLLPVVLATAVLAACERAPTPETPAPETPAPAPAPPPAPVVQPVIEAAPPPPPPPPPLPVQASEPPAARNGRQPLVRILAIAQRRVPGEVIKVDLDEDDDDGDPPTYELEILTPDGRVMEIKLDARTGEILEVEED